VSYKQIFLLIPGLLICSILFFFWKSNMIDVTSDWEFFFSTFTMLIFFYAIFTWYKLNLGFLSPTFLMFISLLLFHLGTIVIVGFNLMHVEYKEHLMIYRYGEELTLPAVLYSLAFIIIYILGVIIFYNKNDEKFVDEKNVRISNVNYKQIILCKKTGIVLLILSIPSTIYVNFIQFNSRITEGYSAVYTADYTLFGLPLGGFTNLFLPGIIFTLIGLQNEKKKSLYILIIMCIYYLVYIFLVGRRADGLLALITLIYVYYNFYKFKLNLFHIIGVYFLMVTMTFIAQTRGLVLGVQEMGMLFLKKVTKENPILELVLEMGGTIRSPILIIETLESLEQYRYGFVYLLGPLAVTFKALGITSQLDNYLSFSYFLRLPERGTFINSATSSMGGSAIAEWYFNFGWIGLPLAIFFGGAMLKYQKIMKTVVNRPYIYGIMCFSLYLVLRYSREYFAGIFWILIYVSIVSFLIYIFLNKKGKVQKT